MVLVPKFLCSMTEDFLKAFTKETFKCDHLQISLLILSEFKQAI